MNAVGPDSLSKTKHQVTAHFCEDSGRRVNAEVTGGTLDDLTRSVLDRLDRMLEVVDDPLDHTLHDRGAEIHTSSHELALTLLDDLGKSIHEPNHAVESNIHHRDHSVNESVNELAGKPSGLSHYRADRIADTGENMLNRSSTGGDKPFQ